MKAADYIIIGGGAAGCVLAARLSEQAVEEYTVFNARMYLGSEDGQWRTTLWSNNVTDEDYFLAAYAGNGPYARVMAMPRTYGVTLDYRF